MTIDAPAAEATVKRSVTVNVPVEHAFRVFTEEFDSWWPRSHHIGSGTLKRSVIECRVGGRAYGEEEDGTVCPWGQVLEWDPPHRFVFAWLISSEWKHQPDVARASDVEVRFTPVDGGTRVDLEHRGFDRMENGAAMREGVGGEGGWGGLLQIFKEKAESN